ncbi:MAG: hypothetical protein NT171_21700 [Planctomycetota bacterium]|nr:hypothetical protein [Planctomycetota bacterium]
MSAARTPPRQVRGLVALGLWLALLAPVEIGAEPAPTTVRLQVFNRSAEPAEIIALDDVGGRTAAGEVAPGGNTILVASPGQGYKIVGRDSRAEEHAVASQPVKAFVFRPGAADGDEAAGVGRVIPPPAALKVDPFHAKFTSAHGFPIVASAAVSDFALLEAAYLVDALLAARPDVRQALIESGARLCILGHDEYTTDLPEFAFLAAAAMEGFPGISGRDFWDARARGTGGSETDPYSSCGEENLLAYDGDPYAAECILIHEFAHVIHLRGMSNVDPSFDARLQAAYDAAMRDGLWKGKYAAVNHHEYFAEGVQCWFDNNRVNDHDHNHVHLRSELLDYDPRLAALCREVFGDTELRYTKPATRLTGHLAGYDPATAPRFRWPERLEAAQRQIRRQAEARSARATDAEPSTDPTAPAPEDPQ